MRFQAYLLLAEKVRSCPQIAQDLQQFSEEMEEQRRDDETSVMLLRAAVGTPELAAVVRQGDAGTLSDEQRKQNMQCALQLYRRLEDDGMRAHDVLWVVNSWMNALAWPFALFGDAYEAEVRTRSEEEREALAQAYDGYAAASLASDCEQRGDTAEALRWRRLAYDGCDMKTMRWMQRTADESGMPMQMRRAQAMRHSALGDPEGLAAYALYLLETGGEGEESAEEKAFQLASLSARLDSAAGHYVLHKSLSDASYLRSVYDREAPGDERGAQEFMRRAAGDAAWELELAIRGGYPRAYLARALEHDAREEYEDAYADLVQSMKDGPLYAGIGDGAHLLAQYCLDGKGTQRSKARALEWARLGVQRGSSICMELADMLESQGVSGNDELGGQHEAPRIAPEAQPVIRPEVEEEKPPEAETAFVPLPETQKQPAAAVAIAQEDEQPDAPGMVYTVLQQLMDQVNRESINLDGVNASDSILVDTYLAGLCSAMMMHDDVQEQDRIYYDGIYDLCDFSPELGQKGYHEEYLHERFAVIFKAMEGYRQEYAALFEREGKAYANGWERKKDVESAVVYEIVEQLLEPDEQAETNLKAAIVRMLDALRAAQIQAG